jgi:predicted AAA+ superfamily ATPase
MEKNYEMLQKGFGILLPMLSAYVCREMESVYKDRWWDEVRAALSDQYGLPEQGDYGTLSDSLDIANCLRLFQRRWHDVFSRKLNLNFKNWASELQGVRNAVAHIGSADLPSDYTERALDTMALLCEPIDGEATQEIRKLYRKVRYGSEEGTQHMTENSQASNESKTTKSNTSGVLTKMGAGSLPSWRKVMEPHPDVAEGRFELAEFAADLSQVVQGKGGIEYRDPVEFFARTYITEGMTGLLVDSLKRVAGKGGQPVIQLKTAFGGGKTHSMLALYHLLHGSATADDLPGVRPILKKAGLTSLPKANVAVLVGTALNPAKRKNPANLPNYTVSTIWGEMAYQLTTQAGKTDLYGKYIRDADRKGVSPGSDNLTALFNECGPCLILMDELVAYGKKLYGVDGLAAGTYDNFITFIQEVTEAARRSENSLVVASIPESDIEIGGEAGKKVLATIEHTFGRMEEVWKPVAANEGFEVVRRRLFLDCKDPEAREKVCEAFSQMYQQNSDDFPLEAKEVDYKKRLLSCYPIHPEVFDRLYEDWATLENFQRTRGVLRLMAAVIHELWMANDEGAMIMPGSLPLYAPAVKDELVRYLPETWNSIVDKEVDGKESIPYQKDGENPRYGTLLACRRVARTIMLGSAPGTVAIRDQGIKGLEKSRILLGVVQPGETVAIFNDALNTLHGSLAYLYNNTSNSRYWYDTKPTLRKTAEDRASQISRDQVEEEIENRLRKIRRESPFSGIHVCPVSSSDVPDEQRVRLVVLRPRYTHENRAETTAAKEFIQTCFENRGTAPRVYRNMLVFAAPDGDLMGPLEAEVKRYLAWTSILSDKEDLNLDTNQIRETQSNLKRSNQSVDTRILETYHWLFVPTIDPDANMSKVEWDIADMGGGTDSIPKKAARILEQNEQLITNWAPSVLLMELNNYLWKDRNDISIKQLWEYLTRYCYLPRLVDENVLLTSIQEGITSGEYFALAGGYDEEKKRYLDLKCGESVPFLHETDLLVKLDAAKAQMEADRKAKESKENHQGEGNDHPGNGGEGNGNGNDSNNQNNNDHGSTHEHPNPRNTHFHMTVTLDNTRVNRDVNTYVQEIIQHLQNVEGATVSLKLNVEVDAPEGIPADAVRTVAENCRTLKVKDFSFED